MSRRRRLQAAVEDAGPQQPSGAAFALRDAARERLLLAFAGASKLLKALLATRALFEDGGHLRGAHGQLGVDHLELARQQAAACLGHLALDARSVSAALA